MDLRGVVGEVDIDIEEHNRAVRAYNRKFWFSIWGILGAIFLVTMLISAWIE